MIDTAGRLHIDDELMVELEQIKAETKPIEVLFVADAMTGQDAVRSAEVFHERVGITGVVLTKMDGDARGGAALSIKQVIGQPVKFVGVGEKYDAIEPFYPDRIAQRILGMGDVLTLIEEVQGKIDEEEAQEQLQKMTSNQFTLEDFRSQLGQFKKLGSMSKLMKMLPEQMTGGLSALGRAIGRGRSADETHRGDHRFDDEARAQRSQDLRRQPQDADRRRFGLDDRRDQSASSAVRADAEDDGADEPRRPVRRPRQKDDGRPRRRFRRNAWRRRNAGLGGMLGSGGAGYR